jgi:hypothetical protein
MFILIYILEDHHPKYSPYFYYKPTLCSYNHYKAVFQKNYLTQNKKN